MLLGLYWRGRADKETWLTCVKKRKPRRAVALSGGGLHSASRREGIVAVGVLLTDLTVDAVHQDFAFLIHGDFAGGQACFFLCVMVRGIALVAGTENSPAVFATGNNMLIFAHIGLLLK